MFIVTFLIHIPPSNNLRHTSIDSNFINESCGAKKNFAPSYIWLLMFHLNHYFTCMHTYVSPKSTTLCIDCSNSNWKPPPEGVC